MLTIIYFFNSAESNFVIFVTMRISFAKISALPISVEKIWILQIWAIHKNNSCSKSKNVPNK